MPPHPVDEYPADSDYFGQHRAVSQIQHGSYPGYYGWPTAPVFTNHAWRSSPMPSPGLHTLENGEWPRYNTPKRPELTESHRAFQSVDGRHDYGFVPRPHANNNHYANDGRGSGNHNFEGLSVFGQVHTPSYGPFCQQPAEGSHKGRKAQGSTEDLDRQRNRESSFRHPPIDYGRRQIRLVRVLPTDPGTPIKCKFALSMVDNKSVRYTALSYTWGPASSDSDIEKIILQKQDFWTRRNLWCFLRQVRDDPKLRANWYWIDALCIDQAENGQDGQQEKNHQVNMMSQIYSNAYLVMTWLGEPEPEEHAALDALEDYIGGVSSKAHQDLIRRGLRYLGDSSYWSRIWIIQEMVLSKRARFRVGDYDFDWDSIYKIRVEARESHTRRLQDMGWAMMNILDLRQDWYKGKPLDLVTGLRDFGTQKCSDPRDKIYGLLGLLRRKPCIADYSKSCRELYVEVVLWAFEQKLLRSHQEPEYCRSGTHPCPHLEL